MSVLSPIKPRVLIVLMQGKAESQPQAHPRGALPPPGSQSWARICQDCRGTLSWEWQLSPAEPGGSVPGTSSCQGLPGSCQDPSEILPGSLQSPAKIPPSSCQDPPKLLLRSCQDPSKILSRIPPNSFQIPSKLSPSPFPTDPLPAQAQAREQSWISWHKIQALYP